MQVDGIVLSEKFIVGCNFDGANFMIGPRVEVVRSWRIKLVTHYASSTV